jgi:DNA-binding NarL/FixJ family response regulator
MRPLVVVHGPPRRIESLLVELARAWRLAEGWALPAHPWDVTAAGVVCVGAVRSPADVEAALLAAARGAGIVAAVQLPEDVCDGFLDDLTRLGVLDERRPQAECDATEAQRLLELLADGISLDDAAQELHISRRTAERRLAAARRALGVRTTAAAVATHCRR